MEISNKQLEEFKSQLDQSAETMVDAELKHAMLILDSLADVLFDDWVEELRNANHCTRDEV